MSAQTPQGPASEDDVRVEGQDPAGDQPKDPGYPAHWEADVLLRDESTWRLEPESVLK